MKSRIFTLFILFTTIITNAQLPVAGTLDTNFGVEGSVFPPIQPFLYPFNIAVQQQTGEIVTTGLYAIDKTQAKYVGFIGRYDFYGNPKADFGTNGILEIDNLSPTFQSVHNVYFESSSPESPLYVSGNCSIDGKNTYYISKYSSKGILDTSYGVNGSIISLKGQIHGDYIYSLQENPITNHQSFKRYHLADGTLDQNFNNGDLPFLISEVTFYSSYEYNINIQSDGKIILCGKSGETGIIARYNNTGHIDTSFATNGYYYTDNTEIPGVQLTKTQSDGKIIFLTNRYSKYIDLSVLGRLNIDGTLDTTYGTAGYFKHTFPSSGFYLNDLEIQSDNKILMCGQIYTGQGKSFLFTARISDTGFLDFWRNDFHYQVSENFSLALIKDSYLFSYGYTFPTGNALNVHPVIQKIHLKSPEVSLNGTSLPSETTDLDLISTDGIIYSKDNVVLAAGDIKFRLDHSDACYWGAATTNSFPEGVSNMGGNMITINDSGTYNVSFNIKTGAYNFINKATLGTVDQNIDSNKFAFYPNPAKEKVTFTQKLKSIRVYTSDGKLMSSALTNNEINISGFSKGVYYFQAVTENNSIIGNKFIKD
ncbi:T9SS type A sorting domain-containing protein [Flavobacterium hercynium]|uniref:Secretion system C-terminal sorting domain-containing protein n=1 Tax=Flavobacterium hercynium TaxID=387094 RepID=A0A226GUQ6_9FLAO|nr:T9SS type A sorting domain-containing protein [Flavobacterium hercynium]OXA85645.1 hypothetical protein B0A66_19150 [Flavobacterium hercynium]SMP36891.1 delta-60 repeat domain-containing protein/Por secretion system C-terminal sorting domain-containing protein [Flavobacterium hercynium]